MAIPVIETYLELVRRLNPEYLKYIIKKEKGTFSEGLMCLLLALFFITLVIIIDTVVTTFLLKPESMFSSLTMAIFFSPFALIILAIVFISVMFLLARLLMGTGSFQSHFYHFSHLACAMLTIIALLSLIPFVGYIGAFLLIIYSAYPAFIIYSNVHKLGKIRSALLAGIPILITAFIFMLVLILIFIISGIGGQPMPF